MSKIELQSSDWLRAAGLRPSKTRLAVLKALISAARPLTHHELDCLAGVAHFDRVTLYRTLEALQKANLVHVIAGLDGTWRFRAHEPEAPTCPGNHPHFICQSCLTMECLDTQALPWVKAPEGAKITGKQLLLYGYCTNCQ